MHSVRMWKPPKCLSQSSPSQAVSSASSPALSKLNPITHALPPKPPSVPSNPSFSGDFTCVHSDSPRVANNGGPHLPSPGRSGVAADLKSHERVEDCVAGENSGPSKPTDKTVSPDLDDGNDGKDGVEIPQSKSPAKLSDVVFHTLDPNIALRVQDHDDSVQGHAARTPHHSGRTEDDLGLHPHSYQPIVHHRDRIEHDAAADFNVAETCESQRTGLDDLTVTNHGSVPEPNFVANLSTNPLTYLSYAAFLAAYTPNRAVGEFSTMEQIDNPHRSMSSLEKPDLRGSGPRRSHRFETTAHNALSRSRQTKTSHVSVVIDSRSGAEKSSGGPDTTPGNDSGPDGDDPADQDYQTTAGSSGDDTDMSQEDEKRRASDQLHKRRRSSVPSRNLRLHHRARDARVPVTTRPLHSNKVMGPYSRECQQGDFARRFMAYPHHGPYAGPREYPGDDSDSVSSLGWVHGLVPNQNYMRVPIEAYWERSPHGSGFSCAVRWFTDPDGLPITRAREPTATRYHDRLGRVSSSLFDEASGRCTPDSSHLRNQRRGFTDEEDELLIELRNQRLTWSKITKVFQESFPDRSQQALQQRWSKHLQHNLQPQRSAAKRLR